MDLQNIVTPVKPEVLQQLLIESNYDRKKTQYLVDGFTNGFDLHYSGPVNRTDMAQNIPLRVGSKFELWEKMMKEVKEKRFAGPFQKIPFHNYIQSPVGLVPKDGGKKTRLIFHLSYHFGKSGNPSVNTCIDPNICTVRYNDIDEAIKCSFYQTRNSSRLVVYAKTDVSSAFRLIPLKRSSWWVLIMMVRHPVTGEKLYFVDKCLPFGASISCAIFQDFSDALKHIGEYKAKVVMAINNYFDDFLFITVTTRECN